jgi:hypothetical protein
VPLLLGQAPPPADDRDLAGWWRLAGDADDSSANRLATTNHGVKFLAKGPDGKSPAATFDGRDSYLRVKPAFRLGTGDFTISLWLRADDSPGGDLVSWYDAKKRAGFHLSLRTNTGVTTCQPNARQLQFGLDAGSEPVWRDEGRPGDAVLAFALATHDGHLYAGTATNADGGVGRVFRYDGPGRWADCGAPDACNAVTAFAAHRGKLYAATSKYRFAGSSLPESKNTRPGGGVYRHDGGSRWAEVGRLPGTEAVGGMVEFNGRLYATSLYRPASFFRYEADGKWTSLPVPGGKRVEALGVFDGHLWATSYDGGHVYRFDGAAWKDYGRLGDNTQTYSFAVHHGRLCVGTWPSGKVFRLKGESWEDLGRLGDELEVMGMLVHNGQLYAGTLPLAEVYRYDGGTTWTRTARLDHTPAVKYRRAWTMAQYKGRLFCSTLPSGRVHSMAAGPCVTHDRELPAGWRHVAAVRQGGALRLYVDGKPAAESERFDPAKFDLATSEPLRIGAGAGDSFRGDLSDVRLYRRALGAEEVGRLAGAR